MRARTTVIGATRLARSAGPTAAERPATAIASTAIVHTGTSNGSTP